MSRLRRLWRRARWLWLNYAGRPYRTWYITIVGCAAAITFDSLWAGVFVALACVDADPTLLRAAALSQTGDTNGK